MVCTRKVGKSFSALLFLVIFVVLPVFLFASDGWKKVAVTSQSDLWYIDQAIGFSSKGSIVSARAFLKFVPARESVIEQKVKKGLLIDGLDAERFHYFVETVEVDCVKNILTISGIDFFDADDVKFFGQIFARPKHYPSTPGSTYDIVFRDLCQKSFSPFTVFKKTLKTKKPFLYFYP